jgi:hypothetical protein
VVQFWKFENSAGSLRRFWCVGFLSATLLWGHGLASSGFASSGFASSGFDFSGGDAEGVSSAGKSAQRNCNSAFLNRADKRTWRVLKEWSRSKGGAGRCTDTIQNLNQTDTLDLDGKKITSLRPLQDFVHLKRLFLAENMLADISALSRFQYLEVLDVRSNPIQEIPVELLPKLRVLNVSDTLLPSLNGLADASELVDLNAHGLKLRNIEVLAGMTHLVSLGMTNNLIEDLGPLGGLTSLRYLYLTQNQISDFSVLFDLKNLSILHWTGNLGRPEVCQNSEVQCY